MTRSSETLGMKTLLLLAALLLLVVPLVGYGAADDVTLTTDTQISVAGITLNITGSNATVASITVNASDFSFALESGSSITVSSPDRRVLSTDAASQYVAENVCTTSESKLKHSSSATGSVTITITPQTSTCTSAATSAVVDSGGGIIYSSPISAPSIQGAPEPTQSTPESSVETLVETPTHISASEAPFTRTLTIGSTGAEVALLQVLLNAHGFIIAASGPGSPGNETEYFGALTQTAVQEFQKAQGIVSSGSPTVTGYGLVGPKTREALSALLNSETTTDTSDISEPSSGSASFSAQFDRDLTANMEHPDVKRLQQLLNADPDTRLAATGPGSPGNETEYFGALTVQAVQAFQAKYGVVSSGTPNTTGYGRVGPKTRTMLKEVFE